MGSYSFQEYSEHLRSALGSTDIAAIATTPTFILTTTVLLAAFVWTKGFHTGRTKCLDPTLWREFPLVKKTQVSPNTAIYRFGLPHPEDVLGLPIGQHISVAAEINGKEIMRSYTPISSDDDRGHFDLLVKTYEKGNISRHLSLLKVGDNIRVKGPKGSFQYSPTLTGHIGMIAGGTGLTPMFQIMKAALKNPFDKTTISLIYANVNQEDILLKEELEELLDLYEGGVGFVTKEQIKEHMPLPTSNSKILMCGPPPMIKAMKVHLDELKYPAPRTVSKLVGQIFVF